MRGLVVLLCAALPGFASPIADISGFGTTTVSGTASSYFSDDPNSVFAGTSFTALAAGSGAGFIEISGAGLGTFWGGSVSIGNYSFSCNDSGCIPSGFTFGTPMAFTLGVPFQVSISSSASPIVGATGEIHFNFSVFNSFDLGFPFPPQKGAKVLISDPPDVPEPTTFLLSGCGLALLALVRRARR